MGNCYKYISLRQRNHDKSLAPCNIFCQETKPGVNGASCEGLVAEEDWKKDSSLINKDDDGYLWVIGQCTCGGAVVELAEEIAGIVADALEQLDNLLCGILLQAFVSIAEIGVNFIPGGQVLGAFRLSVKAAKTFTENGLEAGGFMGNWVGKVCDVSHINFDPLQVFNPLTQYDDSYGTSIGCKRKDKSACKEMPSITSPTKNDKPPAGKPSDILSGKDKATSAAVELSASSVPNTSRTPDMSSGSSHPPTSTASSISGISSNTGIDVSTMTQSGTKPTSEPESLTESTRTSGSDSSTISSSEPVETHSACGLMNRAVTIGGKQLPLGKIGEDERSTECVKKGKDKTVHITKTKVPIGWYTSVLPQKCPREYSQACYHYRSVMSVHTLTPDMIQFTCGATANTGLDGQTTSSWGSTLMASLPAEKKQHNFAWANGFVELTESVKIGGKKPKTITHGCDRDEWPPRYFWPGDIVAAAKGLKQRVRFLPDSENRGAGQIWKQFCNKNAAQVTEVKTNKASKTQDTTSYIHSDWIRTVGTAIIDKPLVVKQTTTIVSTVSVDTGRAVFTFADWDGLPEDKDWHGLKENRCWPKAIASEDPGWVLLTDDEFYVSQHPTLAKHATQYSKFPDLALLQAALLKRDPVNLFRKLDAVKALKKFGEDGIPLEFQGILPGVPKFSTPKPPRRIRGLPLAWRNVTGPPEEAGDEALLEDGEVEPEEMDDEEWSEWMQNFAEEDWEPTWEEDTPTVPNEVEVIPTPVGQGDATATPALAGVLPSAGWAVATGFVS
ncbi:hypothetical protein BKA61DRAFT_697760 [Leptodontidium sp. MPI-SDFR-AT-0119]|nr:hypothetical protein BKA61DRAFT_697760 [Leptodontidium sp. MPI-SDFR-AT-0119]